MVRLDRRRIVVATWALAGLTSWVPSPALVHAEAVRDSRNEDARGSIQRAYEALPLVFIRNQGQLSGAARFYEQGPGHFAAFGADGLHLALSRRGAAVERFRLFPLGAASPLQITPEGLQPGRVNYLVGKDRSRWRTNLPAYQALVYKDVYPGVDVRFYGTQQQLEYDVVLAPGADPARVRLGVEGAQGLRLLADGDLSIELRGGRLVQKAPVLHQTIDGRRVEVKGRFKLLPASGGERAGNVMAYGFEVGSYDRRHPLVIDPVLVYSSYLGGSGSDSGFAIVVRGDGTFFAAGETASADFDTTVDALDTSANGNVDAWVARFDITQSGSASLAYSTYLGGQSAEGAVGVEVDADGNAYLTGYTDSSDFPTTAGAFDTTHNGGRDAFLAKLSAAGDALLYATLLGTAGTEQGLDLGLDATGVAYVTGFTNSAAFPTTAGAFDTSYNGGRDVFAVKIDPAGAGADDLVYSTFLGGGGDDQGNGIDVTAGGIAYVVGQTVGQGFPATANAFDAAHHAGTDAFLSVLNAAGSSLSYATFIGLGGDDFGKGVAVDSAGRAYMVVQSNSNLPTTPGSFDTNQNGGTDGYVAKLDPARSGVASLRYATFLGGNGDDGVFGISVDDTGGVCVTGFTSSDNFPTRNPLQASRVGNVDLFLSHLNPAGTALTFSTYLGGTADDIGYGVDILADKCCVAGTTSSSNFPVTPEAFQATNDGLSDACVFCVDGIIGACPTITVAPTTAGNAEVDVPYSQQFTQTGGVEPINWTHSGTLPPGLTLDAATGVLSGTPTVGGIFEFTINATDANGCSGSRDYILQIPCPVITVNPATANNGFVGVAYSQQFTQSGGLEPGTWAIIDGNQPNGLTLSPGGLLSGTPTQDGQFTFTVNVTDASGCMGSRQYTVTIALCPVITVTPLTAANGFVGVAYSQDFDSSGGVGTITWSSTGTLPNGLSLNPSTGLLSGTPSQAGEFTFTIVATDDNGCTGSRQYTVTISDCPAITITPGAAPTGFIGVAYSVDFDSSGGAGTITWSFSGTLPNGLSLNTSTGVLSGMPTQLGEFTFTITATDQNGCTGSQQYTVTITTCPVITVDPTTAANGFLDVAYSQQFTQTGGTGVTWSFTGTLPPGLTLNPSTGLLTGTPTATGTFVFTIFGSEAGGCTGSRGYSVTIGVPTPFALEVDTAGNAVFEPNETVTAAPQWFNPVPGASVDLTATASGFTGPGGPPNQTYTTVDAAADYGTIAGLTAKSCTSIGNCYSFGVSATARPTFHWDTTFVEDPSVGSNKTWTLHIGDSFADVPLGNGFYRNIEIMLHRGVTNGCGITGDRLRYCPADSTTREQMSKFVLISKEGPGYVPPACNPADPRIFADVTATNGFCGFVEELSRRGVVNGCGVNPPLYCPKGTVTREQMSRFVLRTLDPSLNPPACVAGQETFADVPASNGFCPFIQELFTRGIVNGCGVNPPRYCPAENVTREQMSKFLGLTFGLTLYGP